MKLKVLLILSLLLCYLPAQAVVLVYSPNGAYVSKADLATFASSPDCVGKTAIVATPQTITAAVVIPADRSVEFRRGGLVTTSDDGSLTFAGGLIVSGGDYQIFSPTAKITLNGSNWGNPRWWGAKGDKTTDDAVPLQTALNSGKTRWTSGMYLTGTSLTAKYDVAFDDWATTAIVAKIDTVINPVLSISGDATDSVFTRSFRNLNVIADARSTSQQSGVIFQRGPNPLGAVAILDIQNIHVSNMNGYGIVFDSVWDSNISNIHTEDCGSTTYSKPAVWVGSTTGDSANQNTFTTLQVERSVYQALVVEPTAYSNRFVGMHIEATTNLGTDIILGGYRSQYYGSGHFGANHRYIYIGGESNVYDGIFFETTVRDGNWNPGTVYRVANSTITGTFDGNGGAGYGTFSNCTIGTFIANGQSFRLENSNTGVLTYSFMTGAMQVQGGTIGIINGSGTLGRMELNGVTVTSSSELHVKTLVSMAKFLADLTFNYTIGSTVTASTVSGNLTLQGNTSDYAYKVNNTNITGNLWVDANEGTSIDNCTVFGNATESGGGAASFLSNTAVKGSISGFAVQSLPTGSTVPTATAGDNSQKLANTAFVKTAVDAVCTSGYTWVDPHTWNYVKCKGTSTAYGYIPNGANPMHSIIGSGVFTAVPTCVAIPATSDTTVHGTMTGPTYDSGTGQVTLSAYSTNSGIGMFAICVGK